MIYYSRPTNVKLGYYADPIVLGNVTSCSYTLAVGEVGTLTVDIEYSIKDNISSLYSFRPYGLLNVFDDNREEHIGKFIITSLEDEVDMMARTRKIHINAMQDYHTLSYTVIVDKRDANTKQPIGPVINSLLISQSPSNGDLRYWWVEQGPITNKLTIEGYEWDYGTSTLEAVLDVQKYLLYNHRHVLDFNGDRNGNLQIGGNILVYPIEINTLTPINFQECFKGFRIERQVEGHINTVFYKDKDNKVITRSIGKDINTYGVRERTLSSEPTEKEISNNLKNVFPSSSTAMFNARWNQSGMKLGIRLYDHKIAKSGVNISDFIQLYDVLVFQDESNYVEYFIVTKITKNNMITDPDDVEIEVISYNDTVKTPLTQASSGDNKVKKPESDTANYSVGNKVTITGSHYATGESIPDWVKKRTHTIAEIGNNKVLLKEIYSWVYVKDIKKA